MLSAEDDSPPRPIQSLISRTPLEHNSSDTTLCVERHVQGLTSYSSTELPFPPPNTLRFHQSVQPLDFFPTGFDLENTLASDILLL